MKTRSNDIIPNAPFSYNSSTNTFEIGTNLEVDGVARLPIILIDPLNDNSGIKIYFDSDNYQLNFEFLDEGLTYTLETYMGDGTILTSDNSKTFFGKSILKGSEGTNIDLYVHYLSIIAGSKFYNGVIYSSNNIVADTLQKLTTLFKATPDTPLNCIILSDINTNTVGLLKWNGDIWQIQLANDNFVNVTSVTDRVETL